MKNKLVIAAAILALLLVIGCAPPQQKAKAPAAAPAPAAPAPAPAEAPAPTPVETSPTGNLEIRGPKVVIGKKIYAVGIENGMPRSQYGVADGSKIIMVIKPGEVVKLAVPYNNPAIDLSGAISQSLKPGEIVYAEALQAGTSDISIEVNGKETGMIEIQAQEGSTP